MRILPLILLAACNQQQAGGSDPTDGPVALADADGDGYTAEDGDCDDNDFNVNVGAQEKCDGLDNDCDGDVDEGVTQPSYTDADGDGYGDPTTQSEACGVEPGKVQNGNDCDDTTDRRYPGLAESCDGLDNDCDGDVDEFVTSTWYYDVDGDGYGDPLAPAEACEQPAGTVADSTDCNDADPNANPAASEVCDEEDNDCDGTPDDGVQLTFWADVDGDGWGDSSIEDLACSAPTGFVDQPGDCDDSRDDIYPSATELCDDVDNDCDGTVDEADSSDSITFYLDSDGDGYGNSSVTAVGCAIPAGYSLTAGDCDDSSAAVFPGATETCNDVDDNCDGTVDEATAVDAATWYFDFDGDGYGSSRLSMVSCDEPTGYADNADDCDDTDADINPGAVEVCDEEDNDCDGVDDDGLTIPTWYLDGDGDGYGDSDDSTESCEPPSSAYVSVDGDCDDDDVDINPAATESCDAIDEDCDGYIDYGACPCTVHYYGSSVYQFCDSATDWVNARAACHDNEYHLVTVTDASEEAWLESTAATYYSGATDDYWWIGYNDRTTEGRWGWLYTTSTYTNWNSGEPSASDETYDCAVLTYGSGNWSALSCNTDSTYICETND